MQAKRGSSVAPAPTTTSVDAVELLSFIHASDKFEGRFGTASLVAMAVVKKEGEIYDTDFLYKVERLTNKLDEAPFVNHYQVSSLTHINTRVIRIEPDGAIVAEPLIDEIPEGEERLSRPALISTA